MAGLTIVRYCSNVFNQAPIYMFGNGRILNLAKINTGLKKLDVVSIQQVCYKQSRVRFKVEKAAKDKSYVFQRKKSQLKQFKEKVDTPEFLARKPADNIWIHKYYPKQKETLEVAIAKHKEYADPMMLDNMEGLVYADMLINMKTKKKTKFLSSVKSIIVYPHKFDAGPTPSCLVLSEKPEDVDKALAAGATYAGGSELFAQLKSEAISPSMYDHVLCTPEIFMALVPLRPIFKDKYPNKKKGNLSLDVEAMLTYFLSGVPYESKKNYEDVSSLQVPFGQLNMNEDHLLENFQKLVDKLCQGRSDKLGPFITEIHIIAPPSAEKFKLAAEFYVPGYDVEPVAQEEEEEPSEEDEGEVIKKKNTLKR